MQWWLNVFFLVNGLWVPGHEMTGWAPRAYETEAQCLERKRFAERQCGRAPRGVDALWICSPGEPQRQVPAGSAGLSC